MVFVAVQWFYRLANFLGFERLSQALRWFNQAMRIFVIKALRLELLSRAFRLELDIRNIGKTAHGLCDNSRAFRRFAMVFTFSHFAHHKWQ